MTGVLRELTDHQLARLEAVLIKIGPRPGRINLDAVADALREAGVPVIALPHLRSEADRASGGRLYELTLLDLDGDLDERYRAEVEEVEALAATGLTYAEAWTRIRGSAGSPPGSGDASGRASPSGRRRRSSKASRGGRDVELRFKHGVGRAEDGSPPSSRIDHIPPRTIIPES